MSRNSLRLTRAQPRYMYQAKELKREPHPARGVRWQQGAVPFFFFSGQGALSPPGLLVRLQRGAKLLQIQPPVTVEVER